VTTPGRSVTRLPPPRTAELVDGIDEHTREQILQAYTAGATVASVKTTFNVGFETARALRDDAA
jgi:hypothetical protein